MSDEPRISSVLLVGDDGVTADDALAMLLEHLADRIEEDPVTSWTADDMYAGLTRLAKVAEQKRRDVEVVRGGRPPTTRTATT